MVDVSTAHAVHRPEEVNGFEHYLDAANVAMPRKRTIGNNTSSKIVNWSSNPVASATSVRATADAPTASLKTRRRG